MYQAFLAQLGDWSFYRTDDHGFEAHAGRPLFAYEHVSDPGEPGKPKTGELYASLEHAMAAAIAEKYTGRRGAGGTGVGTAADWFMRMIGADQLVEVDYQEGQKALQDTLAATRSEDGPIYSRARKMGLELEKRGLVIAKTNTP